MGETAAEKTSEIVESVKDRAYAMGEVATDKVTDLAGVAKERVQEWSTQARSSTQEIAERCSLHSCRCFKQLRRHAPLRGR